MIENGTKTIDFQYKKIAAESKGDPLVKAKPMYLGLQKIPTADVDNQLSLDTTLPPECIPGSVRPIIYAINPNADAHVSPSKLPIIPLTAKSDIPSNLENYHITKNSENNKI